jgi:Fe-S oxidoreductase
MISVAMLVLLVVTMGVFSWSAMNRTKVLMAARPSDRFNDWWERVDAVLVFMFGQKKMFKEFIPGAMHALIFWGFLVLLIRSMNLIIAAFTSHWHFDMLGFWDPLSIAYAYAKDISEAVVAIMILFAFFRRIVLKPWRMTINADGYVVLGLILGLMITDFLMDGVTFAYRGAMVELAGMDATVIGAEANSSPVGALFAIMMKGLGLSPMAAVALRHVFYWLHVGALFFFLNYLPYSKHMHVLTVVQNVFFFNNKKGLPLETPSDLEAEFEKEEPCIGASKLEDLSWSHLLNVYTCTECGRCLTNCPAYLTDKPLAPKEVNEVFKHHIDEIQPFILGKKKPEEREAITPMIAQVKEEAIWSCTTCRSCEENCPVLNEYVQGFVDMRRYLAMMEGSFPSELNTVFKNLENKSNAWGLPMGDREKWCDGLDVSFIRDKEPGEVDYLFWVGCAGAYDDASQKTARAIVKILNAAGVSFALLGNEEGCTGDTARRLGNEYLYQIQAATNIEVFNGYGVKKIIVMCPHCFQTIGNEYPDLGGEYEVIHHATFIQDLVKQGKITLTGSLDKKVLYHDSCYLGRYNDIYDAPRDCVKAVSGATIIESERSHEDAMCCGAGGGWFWMEEHGDKRMNVLRTEQCVSAKPDVISTACPFCKVMLKDGVGFKELDEQIAVKDVAEIVADALQG